MSPLNTAVKERTPAAVVAIDKSAENSAPPVGPIRAVTVVVPSKVVPSKNATDPVGVRPLTLVPVIRLRKKIP